ncbi:MAG: hypothetical protein II900_03785 [Prevotella sp.]|jgi:hypothetical protein|nr:hypothetical protein [Prevotella sp.]
MATDKKLITLKTLNKSNVWELQENDVFRIWSAGEKDADMTENINRYITILRSAFEIEEVKVDRPEVIRKYEMRGMCVGLLRVDESNKVKYAIKKRPILRVTDLTYENIRHISAAKLLEVIERNFGGGWDSLSQSIKDIIESGFDISTTTLPKDRLHKPGGLYEKKLEDGFDVLEIPKGLWTEAIFAKEKPEMVKVKMRYDEDGVHFEDDDADSDEDVDIKDDYYKSDEDDDAFDDDKLTEESYRTTYDTDPDELGIEAEEVGDDEDY